MPKSDKNISPKPFQMTLNFQAPRQQTAYSSNIINLDSKRLLSTTSKDRQVIHQIIGFAEKLGF